MEISQQKAQMRQQILNKRDGLAEVERIEMSLRAGELGADHVQFAPGTVVSGFFPIRSEIDARPLLDRLAKRGARLCLPVILDKATICFRELVKDGELVDTGFGTRGPGDTAQVLDPEILIMPLAVFDSEGNRIGYGAGHYDRAIDRLQQKGMTPQLIGLAFCLQELPWVPAAPYDKPLDAIITENGFRRFRT